MDATHLSHLTTSLQSPTVVRRKYSVAGLQSSRFRTSQLFKILYGGGGWSLNLQSLMDSGEGLCQRLPFLGQPFLPITNLQIVWQIMNLHTNLPLQRSSTLSLKANSSASVSLWAEAREREVRRRRSMMLVHNPASQLQLASLPDQFVSWSIGRWLTGSAYLEAGTGQKVPSQTTYDMVLM